MKKQPVPPQKPNQQQTPARSRKPHKAVGTFHEDAFRLWVKEKLSYKQLGERIGVVESTVFAWAKKEQWGSLLQAISERAKVQIVKTEAERIASASSRHQRIARLALKKVWRALKLGTIMIDPMSGQFYREKPPEGSPEGAAGPVSRRELLPGEINQAIQAFERAANLEFGRLGGNTSQPGDVNLRFPDLVVLLDKIWRAKQGAAPARGKVISVAAIPQRTGSDPREDE